MGHGRTSRTVAIIDSHPDTFELLRVLFEGDGFRVILIDLDQVRAGLLDVQELRTTHAFDAAVVDITLPYQANWETVQNLRAGPLAGLPTILTTTNVRALSALVGQTLPDVLEIWGKPYDLSQLRMRVHAVLNLPERRGSSLDPRGRDEAPDADRRCLDRRRPAVIDLHQSGNAAAAEVAASRSHPRRRPH